MPDYVTAYTLVVLAGGQGSRMGGCDKGLLTFGEQTFVENIVQRMRCTLPGVNDVLISANRNHGLYRRIGAQVCADLRPGFQGPLAGLEATLAQSPCHQPVVIVPCDMPLLPSVLPLSLLSPVIANPVAVAVLHDGQRRQHLCLAFWPQVVLPSIREQLNSGQRSVSNWLSGQLLSEVLCSEIAVAGTLALINVNKSSDFRALSDVRDSLPHPMR